jgi:3-oxoacyl-[acyl-carrier-protein] synthase-3
MINKVISVGKYTPNKILTNHDLEKMVDTSDEWISDRTGIKERRIASNTETASYMGAEAIKRACDKINMPYEEIDFVICATNSPDTLFPSKPL